MGMFTEHDNMMEDLKDDNYDLRCTVQKLKLENNRLTEKLEGLENTLRYRCRKCKYIPYIEDKILDFPERSKNE